MCTFSYPFFSLFNLYQLFLSSHHSPQFTSALILLFSLLLSSLFLYPSWPLYSSLPVVRLLLTNEATAWPQAAVHQGHDPWGPSQSNDTKALSTVPLFSPFSLPSSCSSRGSALHNAKWMSITDTMTNILSLLTWSKDSQKSQAMSLAGGFTVSSLFAHLPSSQLYCVI